MKYAIIVTDLVLAAMNLYFYTRTASRLSLVAALTCASAAIMWAFL